MHLSLLSDSFLSDRLDDAGIRLETLHVPTGRQHRDGLVRGLCFLAVLAVPLLLGFWASLGDRTETGVAGEVAARPTATAAMPLKSERRS